MKITVENIVNILKEGVHDMSVQVQIFKFIARRQQEINGPVPFSELVYHFMEQTIFNAIEVVLSLFTLLMKELLREHCENMIDCTYEYCKSIHKVRYM